MSFDLTGYVDVATRLDLAFQRFPDLRIQETKREIVGVNDHTFIAVQVTVWRTLDDALPVVAEAWETFPGRTAFTKGSEYQNASTSALGRALRFAGISAQSPIASTDEVKVRKLEQSTQPVTQPTDAELHQLLEQPASSSRRDHPAGSGLATAKQVAYIRNLMRKAGVDNWIPPDGFTSADASALIEELKEDPE